MLIIGVFGLVVLGASGLLYRDRIISQCGGQKPPAMRFRIFNSLQVIIMSHGISDRDPGAYDRLRRLSRRSFEATKTTREVNNP